MCVEHFTCIPLGEQGPATSFLGHLYIVAPSSLSFGLVTVHEEDLALNHVLASVGGDEALIPRRLALLALDDVRGLGDCLRQWLPDETVLSPSQEFEFGLDGPRKRGS